MGRGGKDLVTPIAGGRETTGKPTDSKHCALSQWGKSQREPPTDLLREWHQALQGAGMEKGEGGKEKRKGDQKRKNSVCHLLFNLRKVKITKEVIERQTGWLLPWWAVRLGDDCGRIEWWEEHSGFRLPPLCFETREACLPALPSLGALWSSRNELSAHLQFTLFAETITLFPNQVLWNMPKAPFLIHYDGHDSRQVLKQNYPKWGKKSIREIVPWRKFFSSTWWNVTRCVLLQNFPQKSTC